MKSLNLSGFLIVVVNSKGLYSAFLTMLDFSFTCFAISIICYKNFVELFNSIVVETNIVTLNRITIIVS